LYQSQPARPRRISTASSCLVSACVAGALTFLPWITRHSLARIGDDLDDLRTYESLSRSHTRVRRSPWRIRIIGQLCTVAPSVMAMSTFSSFDRHASTLAAFHAIPSAVLSSRSARSAGSQFRLVRLEAIRLQSIMR
jgi:hypothetical protein